MDSEKLYEVYFRLCVWLFEKNLLTSLSRLVGESGKAILDENKLEEYDTVMKIVKIYQSIFEVHAHFAEELLTVHQDAKILYYLCDRIMPNFVIEDRVVDDIKFHASDLLV